MNNRTIKFNEKFYLYSLIWGTFSSIVIFILIKAGIRTQAVFALKDMVIYLLAFGVLGELFNSKKVTLAVLLTAFLMLFIYLNYVILNPLYQSPINNVRQIMAPPILLLIFCCVKLDKPAVDKLLKIFYKIVIIVFVLGAIEQSFELWAKLDLSEYFRLKNIPTDSRGLSYMFYEPRFNNRERMTSVLIDPISLGHFFASAGIFIYYMKDKSKLAKYSLYCCVIGLFLALSKGAILQFAIGIVIFNERIWLGVRACIVFLGFIFFLSIENLGAGINHHIGSFLNSIESLRIFGYGIGNAGNYAIMFGGGGSAVSRQLDISDTYVGSLLGQIGAAGTLFWLLLCVIIIYIGGGERYKNVNTSLKIFISIFGISILSENTMNVTSFLLPAIMIALSSQIERYRNEIPGQNLSIA